MSLILIWLSFLLFLIYLFFPISPSFPQPTTVPYLLCRDETVNSSPLLRSCICITKVFLLNSCKLSSEMNHDVSQKLCSSNKLTGYTGEIWRSETWGIRQWLPSREFFYLSKLNKPLFMYQYPTYLSTQSVYLCLWVNGVTHFLCAFPCYKCFMKAKYKLYLMVVSR